MLKGPGCLLLQLCVYTGQESHFTICVHVMESPTCFSHPSSCRLSFTLAANQHLKGSFDTEKESEGGGGYREVGVNERMRHNERAREGEPETEARGCTSMPFIFTSDWESKGEGAAEGRDNWCARLSQEEMKRKKLSGESEWVRGREGGREHAGRREREREEEILTVTVS